LVKAGDVVKKGDVLADGWSTENGKLALGKNMLVAFIPWRGYNFEDAIILSENVMRSDALTSVTIQEFKCEVRDTLIGPEEITADVPNITEEAKINLDEYGVIRVGAYVESDDLLVGKVSPKGEREFTPEERLLQAIFGDKARDVKDTSLRVPAGIEGTILDVQILSRRLEDAIYKKEIETRQGNIKKKYAVLIEKIKSSNLSTEEKKKEVSRARKQEQAETNKTERGDELPHGVLRVVKVCIAQRRNVSIGDKLSGRHGNKGVIAKIAPVEDMPYLEDGTPVDIVLNPLGVPSRMNVGQILESNLGWAAKILGYEAITPPFDGATIEEIVKELEKAGLPGNGKVKLIDGRSGEEFDEKITVGYIYMMKLHHMVEDKVHARSTGSYALITQQPLGGRTQFGGQRFGEMEVWALESYGAAYTLQEILTVKSDDIPGRRELYEAIIKGNKLPKPSIPTSFDILIKELNALCLETNFLWL